MRNIEEYVEITDRIVRLMKEHGADDCEANIRVQRLEEIQAEARFFNLMRGMDTESVSMTVLKNGRKGTVSVNTLSEDAVKDAVMKCIVGTEDVRPDPANGIAEPTENGSFRRGAIEYAPDVFARRMIELAEDISVSHPELMYDLTGQYIHEYKLYGNSNGVAFADERGRYDIYASFTATKNGRSASFGPGANVSTIDPNQRYSELGEMNSEMERAERLLDPRPVGDKFVGTLLAMPYAAFNMLRSVQSIALSDDEVIDGTSRFGNALGTKVANENLTWSFAPHHPDIVLGDMFTAEGYRTGDFDVIRDGVLKNFCLSRYGAARTGYARAANPGINAVVKPGTQTVREIISKIDRGVILGRYSGNQPTIVGDISGVAKNSFYIENGRIVCPIHETMISGNLFEMLMNIRAVSADTVKDGNYVLPWIAFDGITIK